MNGTPKNVGRWFKMLPDKETSSLLADIAKETTFAEDTLWELWRKYDPVSPFEAAAMRQQHEDDMVVYRAKLDEWKREHDAWESAQAEEAGEPKKPPPPHWPKLPPYFLKDVPEGESGWEIAKALCPSVNGNIFGAVANHVRKLYCKTKSYRRPILYGEKRLPKASEPRIRFRDRAIRIRRHDWTDKHGQTHPGYAIIFRWNNGESVTIPIIARKESDAGIRWLEYWCDQNAGPCGGVIYRKQTHSRKEWRIALARPREESEIVKVKSPIGGRELCVYAPLPTSNREDFLLLDVIPQPNRMPWRMGIESNDLILTKLRMEERKRRQGRAFAQSRETSSASRDHGRVRRERSRQNSRRKYGQRCNSWIENRSRAIVDFALRSKCSGIAMENLTERDSQTLRLGEFPYFRLMDRTQQKAVEAGLEWRTFRDLSTISKALVKVATGDTSDEE